MNFLFAGTAIVWLSILAYIISVSVRQNKMTKKMEDLEQRVGNQTEDRYIPLR